MGVNNFLLLSFKKNILFLEKNFLKLNCLFFEKKSSTFILGKKFFNYFYKFEKLFVFFMEIFCFYLDFLNTKNVLFFVSDSLNFFLSKDSVLRSFQHLFFGEYSCGFFRNYCSKNKKIKSFFNKIDIFFLFSIKSNLFSVKELFNIYKPFVFFLEKKNLSNNQNFYRIFSNNQMFFFNYLILKLNSDFLIKIQIYDFIKFKLKAFH